jgi:hypothetical protein
MDHPVSTFPCPPPAFPHLLSSTFLVLHSSWMSPYSAGMIVMAWSLVWISVFFCLDVSDTLRLQRYIIRIRRAFTNLFLLLHLPYKWHVPVSVSDFP